MHTQIRGYIMEVASWKAADARPHHHDSVPIIELVIIMSKWYRECDYVVCVCVVLRQKAESITGSKLSARKSNTNYTLVLLGAYLEKRTKNFRAITPTVKNT